MTPSPFTWNRSTITCLTYWTSLINTQFHNQKLFEVILCNEDPDLGLTQQ